MVTLPNQAIQTTYKNMCGLRDTMTTPDQLSFYAYFTARDTSYSCEGLSRLPDDPELC